MSIGDGFDGRDTFAAGAARMVETQSLLIGVKQDMLIPAAEMEGAMR